MGRRERRGGDSGTVVFAMTHRKGDMCFYLILRGWALAEAERAEYEQRKMPHQTYGALAPRVSG